MRRPEPARCSSPRTARHGSVATPALPIAVNGAGDAVAALFLGHYLLTRGTEQALGRRRGGDLQPSSRRRRSAGTRELQLIAAQDAFAAPRRRFRRGACVASAQLALRFAAAGSSAGAVR